MNAIKLQTILLMFQCISASPQHPFDRVHIDFAGPFHAVYYLILVDAYTKWPEIYTMRKINTFLTIQILRKIFAQFGLPRTVVTDNGTQFTSAEFQTFLKSNGIMHKRTAPYHPATNGQAERYVQTLKQSLRAMKYEIRDRERALANMLMQYRKMQHTTTGQSPAMLMFGRQIRTKIDLLKPSAKQENVTNRNYNVREFEVGSRIAARDYTTNDKWFFGRISKRIGLLHYLVKLDDGRTWKRHVDQLREIGEGVPTDITNTSTAQSTTESENNNVLPENLDISTNVNSNVSSNVTDTSTNASETISADTSETSEILDSVPENYNSTPVVRRSSRVRRPPNRLNL